MKVGPKISVPKSNCLNCRRELDAATNIDGKAVGVPPGSFTICVYCGHLMVYGDDSRLRELTDAEMIEVAGDPRLLAIQWARGKAIKAKRIRKIERARENQKRTPRPLRAEGP